MPMMFTRDFRADLEAIDFFGAPFALVRFGDGERAIIDGLECVGTEGWSSRNASWSFRKALRRALEYNDPGYYLGLGCPCCDPASWLSLMHQATAPYDRITNSNIFVNGNHAAFRERLERESLLDRAFWVVSDEARPAACWGDDFLTIPANAVEDRWSPDETVERLLAVERPIFLCAGPAAPIIAHRYWRAQREDRRVSIVDLGSAIDDLLYGKPTRAYFDPNHELGGRMCGWIPPFVVEEYRYLGTSDARDDAWLEWPRCYELPFLASRLDAGGVHSICDQSGDDGGRLAKELERLGLAVSRSEVRGIDMGRSLREKPSGRFDAAFSVSRPGAELEPIALITTLLCEVRPGGKAILTFERPDARLDVLDTFLGRGIAECPGERLNGGSSPADPPRNVGVVVLERMPASARVSSPNELGRPARHDITAVLTGFRRPEYLEEQLEAIRLQSIPPTDVVLWLNEGGVEFPERLLAKCGTVVAHRNFGVWARFAFALLTETKYVCMFDDDTVPGRRWLENCLRTMRTHRGLLGARGLIFDSSASYEWTAIGVEQPRDDATEVDIAGHCWFFEREWLTAFWREFPREMSLRSGEDVHFSHMLQKYLGLRTFVPPHPPESYDLWGTHPEKSSVFGNDEHSIWMNDGPEPMERSLREAVEDGFRVLRRPRLGARTIRKIKRKGLGLIRRGRRFLGRRLLARLRRSG